MTVTSVNHNPKNESKYARRRSVWKGSTNQLLETIAGLRKTHGVTIHEYWEVVTFETAWGLDMTAGRVPPKFLGTGKWVAHDPSKKFVDAVPQSCRSDLRTLWLDFVTVLARRIGYSRSAFFSEREQMNQIKWTGGHSLIVFAPGANQFDLVAITRRRANRDGHRGQLRGAMGLSCVGHFRRCG